MMLAGPQCCHFRSRILIYFGLPFKSLHCLCFLSKTVLFISIRCWQLRLKISKTSIPTERKTKGLCYCWIQLGVTTCGGAPVVCGPLLCEKRATWSKQSPSNAFFKLCLNITCNYISYHVFTVPLMILIVWEVLSTVTIFFSNASHSIGIKQWNLLPGNQTFWDGKNWPPKFFFVIVINGAK